MLDVRPISRVRGRPHPRRPVGPGQRAAPTLRSLPKDAEIVAYCRGPYCVYADDAVRAAAPPRRSAPAGSRTDSRNGNEPACPSRSEQEDDHARRSARRSSTRCATQVRDKYREVAVDPHGAHHFHTGRPLAARLGYDQTVVDALPDRAVESFAGVGNPFSLAATRARRAGRRRRLRRRVRLVHRRRPGRSDRPRRRRRHDPGDARQSRERPPAQLGLDHVEFREGLAETLPVEDGWADVVISNGVINLCADKQAVFAEIRRVLRPGGVLQFADIANGRPVPPEAMRDIDLWTG